MPRVAHSVSKAFKINLTVKANSARDAARLFKNVLQRPDLDDAASGSQHVQPQTPVSEFQLGAVGRGESSGSSGMRSVNNAMSRDSSLQIPGKSSEDVKYLTKLSKQQLRRIVEVIEEGTGYRWQDPDLCLEAIELVSTRKGGHNVLFYLGGTAMSCIWSLWRWKYKFPECMSMRICTIRAQLTECSQKTQPSGSSLAADIGSDPRNGSIHCKIRVSRFCRQM